MLKDNGDKGDANDAVIKALQEANALIARGRLKHQYPHSWRSKKPVIFRNTPQWFIAMDRPIGGATSLSPSFSGERVGVRGSQQAPDAGRSQLGLPLTLTLSPQAGRGDRSRRDSHRRLHPAPARAARHRARRNGCRRRARTASPA